MNLIHICGVAVVAVDHRIVQHKPYDADPAPLVKRWWGFWRSLVAMKKDALGYQKFVNRWCYTTRGMGPTSGKASCPHYACPPEFTCSVFCCKLLDCFARFACISRGALACAMHNLRLTNSICVQERTFMRVDEKPNTTTCGKWLEDNLHANIIFAEQLASIHTWTHNQ